MIHYTCDRCKRVLDSAEDLRYVVKVEVYPVMDSGGGEPIADDRDHLLEIHEVLECSDADSDPYVSDKVYQKRRFDLCPQCHRKFIDDPLGREHAAHVGFSPN